ncbi:MAG: nucleotide sugar dehydrogenase [Hyphomicrobiales bacterium]|nr:nucleotide sugar dehydrogenase [Hyphomicrobiales bacterium]
MAETNLPRAGAASRLRPEISALAQKIASGEAKLGIIGLGYVGMPLALTGAKAGLNVLGFDINAPRVAQINRGESFLSHIPSKTMRDAIAFGRLEATSDFDRLSEPDAILICVPTPLTKQREPNLSYVVDTARALAARLRPGQLVVLESTTYPGTTTEVLKPILEATGLKSGSDFLLAFSPEREDPGNPDFATAAIPKVVGGDGEVALRTADALYAKLVVKTVPVSSPATAEAVKLTENIFRSVNIALVNELKLVYDAMGIDIWEVIEAAKTKPFGYMAFYPGPGLGGHCIPIDPFYLTWKAREYELSTRFIELAGEINTAMPHHVVDRLAVALDRNAGVGLNGAKILVIGVAYKKNVDDTRESPSLKLIELLEERGATVAFHDPFIATIPRTRKHAALAGRKSTPLDSEVISSFAAVLIATDHDSVDYALLARHAKLIIDTRNVFARAGLRGAHIVKA